ncbi:MAG TPA: hypothetical protein VEX43_08250 [Chthoniobacterales bacterium]|nr:hypothetical protein [Chthoniobacterales bacterium]
MSDETLPQPRASGHVASDPKQRREYTLCYREGVVGVFLRMDDRPILLHENGLQWSAPNSPMQLATFEDIVRIRLVAGSDGDTGLIGSCIIYFKNSRVLHVMGGNNWGLCDAEKAELYRQFVHDLHRRLSAKDSSRIEFVAGQTKTSRGLSQAAMIVGALFFLVLPLGLFVVTGEPECLFIMLGGFAFASPLFGLFKANTPRNYSPKNIPAELLP